MNLINVAVTQGSKKERQAERLVELQNACNYLGYGVQTTGPNGLEKVTPKTREQEPKLWAGMVKVIADILTKHQPRVILFPHDRDWNGTHIGVHHLVMDALKQMPAGFECYLVETEFWGAMDDPNLMVEVSEPDLADLITAHDLPRGRGEAQSVSPAAPGLDDGQRAPRRRTRRRPGRRRRRISPLPRSTACANGRKAA